jgi:hypothetical protein
MASAAGVQGKMSEHNSASLPLADGLRIFACILRQLVAENTRLCQEKENAAQYTA